MDSRDKDKIIRNIVFLKENLSEVCIFKVLDILIQNEIFELKVNENVRSLPTTEDKCQRLIDELMRASPPAYRCFLEGLEKSGNSHIIIRLEHTEEKKKTEDTPDLETPHSPSTELRLVLEEVRESAQEHHETAKIQEEITQELQNMVMKQCNQVKDLMEGTRQLQAEIQTEREQNKLLKYQIQTDNQEYQELLTKQQKLREKIIEYQQRLYDMNRENVALKRELDDNDTKGNAELENLQKQLESFKSENNQLQRQIDRIQSSNSHLLHQTQSLINENFQLKTMITQLERDLKEERRKRRDTGKLPRLPPSYYNQKPFKL